jgi:RimJ/RimL family protein N-acetyltransferase
MDMESKALSIRPATQGDLAALLEFEQAVIAAERPFDPTIKQGKTNYYNIPELIASPDVLMVVAEIDGKPIGSGYARIEESKIYNQHARHAYLGFMYTVPEQRGLGVNREIIEALFDWSRKRDVTEIRLEVYSNNVAAIRAYEKVGFEPNLVTMRTSLA